MNTQITGRSSDLSLPYAFPFGNYSNSGQNVRLITGLTAAGTVGEFHAVPFSSLQNLFVKGKKIRTCGIEMPIAFCFPLQDAVFA
jgi:hypothetical protein